MLSGAGKIVAAVTVALAVSPSSDRDPDEENCGSKKKHKDTRRNG
jgi:hypothetical protein